MAARSGAISPSAPARPTPGMISRPAAPSVFPGFADSSNGDYNAGTAQAFGELGYRHPGGHRRLRALRQSRLCQPATDGFTETGRGGGAVERQRHHRRDLHHARPARLDRLTSARVNADCQGHARLAPRLRRLTPLASLAFAGGDAFTIAGVPIARDAAVVEAGLDFALSPNATLGISYGGQFGSGFTDQSVQANFNVKF